MLLLVRSQVQALPRVQEPQMAQAEKGRLRRWSPGRAGARCLSVPLPPEGQHQHLHLLVLVLRFLPLLYPLTGEARRCRAGVGESYWPKRSRPRTCRRLLLLALLGALVVRRLRRRLLLWRLLQLRLLWMLLILALLLLLSQSLLLLLLL